MNRVIRHGGNIIKREGTLGQLDMERDFGPSPLPYSEIPPDLLPKYIKEYGSGGGSSGAPGGGGGSGQNSFGDLGQIGKDVHSIAGTLSLNRGLLGRLVTVTGTPQLIINAQDPGGRGYLLLNPAGTLGLTASGTLISSQTAVGATTVTSGSLGVANYNTARFFIEAVFNVGAGPVTFDLQTRNPVTGTYITSQTIASLSATGNLYASVGQLGVDTDLRMFVTVPAGTTITFSVGFVTKDGLEGTSTGVAQTIFIGGPGVASQSGYPILSGKERSFYLNENVQLYAVTGGPSLNLNIFEL
jgi:hypothetical protein